LYRSFIKADYSFKHCHYIDLPVSCQALLISIFSPSFLSPFFPLLPLPQGLYTQAQIVNFLTKSDSD